MRFTQCVGLCLVLYFGAQYQNYNMSGIYSMLWICNVSVFVAGIGLLLNSLRVVQVTVASVAFAHLSWCFDVILKLTADKMIFGAKKLDQPLTLTGTAYYVFDPSRTVFEILATLHHIWFIPLCLAILFKHSEPLKFWEPALLSSLFLIFFILLGRMAPLEFNGEYLNINIGHELWRKGKFPAWVTDWSARGWFPYYFMVRWGIGLLLDVLSFGLIWIINYVFLSKSVTVEKAKKN